MKITELFETVNDKIFWAGFEEKKPILDGEYTLIAKAGYMTYSAKPKFKSEQFRIEAREKRGSVIGWVNFEKIEDHLEALDLWIAPAHRRKGIATEMYSFARELGNDIYASEKQTAMGKLFWSKDHSK